MSSNIYFIIVSIINLPYANNSFIINLGGALNMNHNESIGCIVSECKFHCKDDDYCTLDKIEVVKHETVAKTKQCTDCGSFRSE